METNASMHKEMTQSTLYYQSVRRTSFTTSCDLELQSIRPFFTILDSTVKTEGKSIEKNVEKTVKKKSKKMLQHFSHETLINLNRIYNVAPPLAPPDFFDTFSGFYLSLRSFLMQLGSICRVMWVVLDTVFSL